MERLLAVIILYHPDLKLLERNISAIIDEVDALLLWNNSPESFSKDDLPACCTEKTIYMTAGENVGISKALNHAHRYAIENGYQYLLTMDQDSVWHDFAAYKQSVMTRNRTERCICGPFAYEEGMKIAKLSGFQENRWQITSGMMVKTDLVTEIGGYNEFFPVDCVDIEFCLRAKAKGYKCYYCHDGYLLQQYGSLVKGQFLGKNIQTSWYSPNRLFTIISGHLMLFKTYHHPDLLKETLKFVKQAYLSAVIVNKDRSAIFKSICSGIWTGMTKSIPRPIV